MKFKLILSLFLLLLSSILLYCRASEKKERSESLIIKLERGAFHFDSFILTDTLLIYKPEKGIKFDRGNVYSKPLAIIISKKQKEELIRFLNIHNFWLLESSYKAKSSCTSGINISISLGSSYKKIISEDYKRDCPKVLFLLEQKLIELSGKDLKRSILPG